MPLPDKINVALREQNSQKSGSERVKLLHILRNYNVDGKISYINKFTMVEKTLNEDKSS